MYKAIWDECLKMKLKLYNKEIVSKIVILFEIVPSWLVNFSLLLLHNINIHVTSRAYKISQGCVQCAMRQVKTLVFQP